MEALPPNKTHIYLLRNVKNNKIALLTLAKQYSSKKLILAKNSNKKPYFKNLRNLKFNISHSKNLTAFAFSRSPVGVDIEYLKSRNLKLIYRIGTKNEISKFEKSKSKKKDIIKLWTQKEAAVKCLGKGVKYGLNKIETAKWNSKTYFYKKYILTVTSKNKSETFKILQP